MQHLMCAHFKHVAALYLVLDDAVLNQQCQQPQPSRRDLDIHVVHQLAEARGEAQREFV